MKRILSILLMLLLLISCSSAIADESISDFPLYYSTYEASGVSYVTPSQDQKVYLCALNMMDIKENAPAEYKAVLDQALAKDTVYYMCTGKAGYFGYSVRFYAVGRNSAVMLKLYFSDPYDPFSCKATLTLSPDTLIPAAKSDYKKIPSSDLQEWLALLGYNTPDKTGTQTD